MKIERNILIAFILNLSFSVIELFGGIITGSMAIFSDSIHDFGDALSVGISYFLERKSKNKPNYRYTYGYIRYSVMGSIIMTFILLIGSFLAIYVSIKRIIHPVNIDYNGMIIIAIFGVLINTLAAFITKHGNSLNQKSVNLHMLEDVWGWVVILIGSILMKYTNISLIDSCLSILVACVILIKALLNMKEIVNIFLEKTPNDISIDEIKQKILSINEVLDVHHFHIRSLDGYHHSATLHLVVKEYHSNIKNKVKKELLKYNIVHSTVEIELNDEKCNNDVCKLDELCHENHLH